MVCKDGLLPEMPLNSERLERNIIKPFRAMEMLLECGSNQKDRRIRSSHRKMCFGPGNPSST